jgi:hypothetical protein
MYRSTFSWPRHWLQVSEQLHISPALPPRKSPRYPLDRRFSGPENLSERRGEDKILAPIETRTPTLGRPTHSQSLYRLATTIIIVWTKLVSYNLNFILLYIAGGTCWIEYVTLVSSLVYLKLCTYIQRVFQSKITLNGSAYCTRYIIYITTKHSSAGITRLV